MILLFIPFTINDILINYDNANYTEVVKIADEMLLNDTFSLQEEIEIRTYLSFSLVATSDTLRAKDEFVRILLKMPDYTLNPDFVSPKIYSVFLKAKDEYNRILKEIKDKTPPPLWYGLILPGTYQYKLESKIKGNIMKYTAYTSIGLLILSFISKEVLHRVYLSQVEQNDIDKWYNYYNLAYKSTFFFSYTTSGLYIFNLLDCLSLKRVKAKPKF